MDSAHNIQIAPVIVYAKENYYRQVVVSFVNHTTDAHTVPRGQCCRLSESLLKLSVVFFIIRNKILPQFIHHLRVNTFTCITLTSTISPKQCGMLNTRSDNFYMYVYEACDFIGADPEFEEGGVYI